MSFVRNMSTGIATVVSKTQPSSAEVLAVVDDARKKYFPRRMTRSTRYVKIHPMDGSPAEETGDLYGMEDGVFAGLSLSAWCDQEQELPHDLFLGTNCICQCSAAPIRGPWMRGWALALDAVLVVVGHPGIELNPSLGAFRPFSA